MKTEIDNDLKAKIFAQYYGQKVMYVGGVGLVEIGNGGWNLKHPDFYLQLMPLTHLSDFDAKNIIEFFNPNKHIKDINVLEDSISFKWKGQYSYLSGAVYLNGLMNYKTYQYLQSKGYAMAYGKYSVNQLVDLGIYKLI